MHEEKVYHTFPMEPECLFCSIALKKMTVQIVHEEPDLVAFRDANPQAPTHILIIPKKHISSFAEATDQDSPIFGKLLSVAKEVANKEGLSKDGYRLVINQGVHGGQTVFHLHLHLMGGRSFHWPPG